MSQSEAPLVNKVAQSGLLTINLEVYYPLDPLIAFDLKDYLFQGLILREKEFRDHLKAYNWMDSEGKHLAVYCSTDAIIPVWAYMLVASLAAPFAKSIRLSSPDEWLTMHYMQALSDLDVSEYLNQRIVIKGCSDKPVPAAAYLELTRILQPVAQSIMYGEPCSTVPIFKRPRILNA